jgi:hypothetical protein
MATSHDWLIAKHICYYKYQKFINDKLQVFDFSYVNTLNLLLWKQVKLLYIRRQMGKRLLM